MTGDRCVVPSGRLEEAGVQRSGPSIEVKIVLAVVGAVVVQDLLLLAMYVGGARPTSIQAALAAVLVLSLVVVAVWGNTISRAIRRLTRACFVARHGDVRVLSEPTRTDELGELNDELNRLILLLRDLKVAESELEAAGRVAESVSSAAPGLLHSSHDIVVSLKELREGAAAEASILRQIAGSIAEARTLLAQAAGRVEGGATGEDISLRLESLESVGREAEVLADEIIDEVARPEIDEAALARAVNGLREAVRTIVEVSGQAAGPLAQRRADARAAELALERLEEAATRRGDGSRVAELMDRSAESGLSEARRLVGTLRRLGLIVEAYEQRRKVP